MEKSGNEIECPKCGYYLNVGAVWEWNGDKLICPRCKKGTNEEGWKIYV